MIEEGYTVVLQSGEKAIVEDIDKVVYDETIAVYNFEVEDFHTHFVSNASVLVHNMCPKKVTKSVANGKITGYTKHKLAQAMGREGGLGVKPSAILEIVKNPIKTVPQDGGKIKYVSKQDVVVLNESGKVITTYSKGSKYWR